MPSAAASLSRVPGRPVVEHRAQDRLVGRDRHTGAFPIVTLRLRSCGAAHGIAAIAALTRATATGETDTVASPVPRSLGRSDRSAPASPQSETSTPRARPGGHRARDQAQHGGIAGIVEIGDRTDVARRGHRVLRQVVGADRIEVGREALRRDRRGRHLDHDAERRSAAGDAARPPAPRPPRRGSRAALRTPPARSPSAA